MRGLFSILLMASFGASGQLFRNTIFFEQNFFSAGALHDDQGNIYALGYTDSHGANWSSSGLSVFVVRKYLSGTKNLAWERKLSSKHFLMVQGCVKRGNKIIIGGVFQQSVWEQDDSVNVFPSAGGYDLFSYEVGFDGNTNIHTTGGTGNEESVGFTVDGSNNLYYTGYATGDFLLGSADSASNPNRKLFLYKCDSSLKGGHVILGRTVSADWGSLNGITYAKDNLYILVSGRVVMDSSPNDTIGCVGSCATYHKFDLNGNFVSAFSIGSFIGGEQRIWNVDDQGNISYLEQDGMGVLSSSDVITRFTKTPAGVVGPASIVLKGETFYCAGNYWDNSYRPSPYSDRFYVARGNATSGNFEQLQTLNISRAGNTYGVMANTAATGYLLDEFLLLGRMRGQFDFGDTTVNIPGPSLPFITIVEGSIIDAVEEQSMQVSAISVYPNPACSTVQIACKSGEISTLKVVNQVGQTVLQQSGTTLIDVTSIPPGLYVIEVLTRSGIKRDKVLIDK